MQRPVQCDTDVSQLHPLLQHEEAGCCVLVVRGHDISVLFYPIPGSVSDLIEAFVVYVEVYDAIRISVRFYCRIEQARSVSFRGVELGVGEERSFPITRLCQAQH